jgi:hypothetical protein
MAVNRGCRFSLDQAAALCGTPRHAHETRLADKSQHAMGVGVQARAGAPLNQSGALAGVVEFLANWECTSHLRGDVFNDPALSISDRSSDNSASYLGAQSGQPSAQFG